MLVIIVNYAVVEVVITFFCSKNQIRYYHNTIHRIDTAFHLCISKTENNDMENEIERKTFVVVLQRQNAKVQERNDQI